MSKTIEFILTVGISILTSWIFMLPLIKIRGKLDIKEINETIPDIQSSNKLITTFSASAIVLSSTALQAFKDDRGSIINSDYILNSLYLFGIAIFFGVLIGIAIYILKANCLFEIKNLTYMGNIGEKSTEIVESFYKKRIDRLSILLGCLVVQLSSFMAAMAFLIAFAKNNIK